MDVIRRITIKIKGYLPYIVLVSVSFFMFHRIFSYGYMSGYDNSFHFYDIYYLINVLIPKQHWISGWSMQYLAGCPILVDYYQTGHLLVAFFNKVLFFPLSFSYKTMILVTYVVLGIGFYKFLSYRFGRIPGLFISLCLLLQKDIYYDRILNGIWSNYLALGGFFIFFHFLDNHSKNMKLKDMLILALLLSLIIFTHLYVAVFACVLLFIYLILNIREKKSILVYSSIPVIAFMISAYYLYGFIVAGDYFVKMPPKELLTGLVWSFKSFFGPYVSGFGFIKGLFINIPVIIRIVFGFSGLYFFIIHRTQYRKIIKFLTAVFIFIFISLVLFSDIMPSFFRWYRLIPFVGTLQTNRFLIYIHIGLYIFACFGLMAVLERLKKKNIFSATIGVLLVISFILHYTNIGVKGSVTLDDSGQMPNIYKLWSWINKNVPHDQRIVYQNTVGNIDNEVLRRSDVFALSGIFTEVPQIGVGRPASPFPQEKFMRNDQGCIFGKGVDGVSDLFIAGMMERFNAGYIVTVEKKLYKKLEQSELFSMCEKFGPFTIFHLKRFKKSWIDFDKEASYRIEKFENHNVVFRIFNNYNFNKAVIKIAYHPLWKAYLNGEPINLTQDRFGLMKLVLPTKGYNRLELVFNAFNPIAVLLSLSSFVITVMCVIIIKRK